MSYHTVHIPDYQWDEVVRRTGKPGARGIRDIVGEWCVRAVANGDEPEPAPAAGAGWRPSPDDVWRPLVLAHLSRCDWCGRLNKRGEDAIYYPAVKPKRVICVSHVEGGNQ